MAPKTAKVDFLKGPVWKCVVAQAIPLTVAQLVHLLYNVVDRVYLGHMGEGNSLALTGVGLTFPIVSLIMAFTALFGNGGVPLFSIERGAGNEEKASRILGNSFALLLGSSLVLTAVGYLFMKPILFAFGASEDSFVYAKAYLDIYLLGTVFSMIARRPLAPVFRSRESRATSFSASSSIVRVTPSISKSFAYCLTSEFFGSFSIRTSASSSSSSRETTTGTRPISSGIRPNFTKS